MNFRTFWIRPVLAALGMVALIVSGYFGLGWLLRTHGMWVERRLGESRTQRLAYAYARSLGTLFPQDSDGDGIADRVEDFFGTNSRDFSSHPNLRVAPEVPGFRFLMPENWYFTNFGPTPAWPRTFVEPGERRRIRARLCFVDDYGVFSPTRALKLELNPNASGQIALSGGVPSGNPMMVPVTADGLLEFDLVAPVDAGVSQPYPAIIIEDAGSIPFAVARQKAPIACAMTEVPAADPYWDTVRHYSPSGRVVRLEWAPQNGDDMYSVEATCDESGEIWTPIALCPHTQTAGIFGYVPDRTRRWGTPTFRVVPVHVPMLETGEKP